MVSVLGTSCHDNTGFNCTNNYFVMTPMYLLEVCLAVRTRSLLNVSLQYGQTYRWLVKSHENTFQAFQKCLKGPFNFCCLQYVAARSRTGVESHLCSR